MTTATAQKTEFTMSRDGVVLRARRGAAPWIKTAVGRDLWEAQPAAEDGLRRHFDRAWEIGNVEGRAAFYAGALYGIKARVKGDELTVLLDELGRVDTTTPSTMTDSLSELLDTCKSMLKSKMKVLEGGRSA